MMSGLVEGPSLPHRIDRSSATPLYHQLERILREDIAAGVYRPGALLPSENEICERYDVSRSVVRQTFANLAHAGLVRTERGRGSFVAEQKLHERFVQRATGFYDDLTRMGLQIQTRVVRQDFVDLPLQVRDFLKTARGLRIDRVRSVDGRVLAFVTTYIPEDRCPGLEHQDLNDRSLYAHLDATYGLRVRTGRRTVEAVAAQGEVVTHLEVAEGTPLLLLRSASLAEDGQALEWFEAWHRADRTMFEVEIVPGETDRSFHGVVVDDRDGSQRPPVTPAPMGAAEADPERESAVAAALRTGLVVAVLRAPRYGDPAALVEGLSRGGVGIAEFTLTGQNALEAIAAARQVDGMIVGAGSVFDAAGARRAIDAGAQFLVTPVSAPQVAQAAGGHPVFMGAFTPSEVWAAWQATRRPVKVFPASTGGPAYLKSLLAPMPQIPLMPSGGVDVSNAGDYLKAGAHAVNVGGGLCPVEAVTAGDGAELERRARELHAAIAASLA